MLLLVRFSFLPCLVALVLGMLHSRMDLECRYAVPRLAREDLQTETLNLVC